MGSMASVTSSSDQQLQHKPLLRWFNQPLFLGLLLAVATVALYYPVHQHPFVNYDDSGYVTDNVHVQSGLEWDTVTWAFTTFDQANWHPVTWMSHALDCQLFQLNPAGHHDVNLLLHVVNVLLLFWVLYQATGFVGRSCMVAALFALHPINVETVAWVAERKNLLSMLFFLLALGAYQWYVQKPRTTRYAGGGSVVRLGIDVQAASDHPAVSFCCYGITGRWGGCLRPRRMIRLGLRERPARQRVSAGW